jgi:hypothetical protein
MGGGQSVSGEAEGPPRASRASDDGRANTTTSTTAVYGGAVHGVQEMFHNIGNNMSNKRRIRQMVPTESRNVGKWRKGHSRQMSNQPQTPQTPEDAEDAVLCMNSGLPAAQGYSHCCRTCKVTGGKSHGPSCQMYTPAPRKTGADGEEEAADLDYDSDESEVVSLPDKDELMFLAKKHQMDVGCTHWAENGEHTWMALWSTSRHELGQFGTGVRLYFEFLVWIGTTFAVLQFFALPMVVMNAMGTFAGDMMGKDTHFGINLKEQTLVHLTLGNLGHCGQESHCDTRSSREMRLFSNLFTDILGSSDWRVKDITLLYSLNDCLIVVLFTVSVFIFRRRRVVTVIEQVDDDNVTATDYSFRVGGLPGVLGCPDGATKEQMKEAAKGEEHARYAEKLKEHFEGLLARMFPAEGSFVEERVVEIVLVRDWERAIGKYQEQGSWLLKKENVKKKLALCRSKLQHGGPSENKASLQKKEAKLKQQLKNTEQKIHDLEDIIEATAVPTIERPVRGAFVIVNEERFKDMIIKKYRPHNSRLTRGGHPERYMFEGKRITCKEAREPMDTIWENMDFPAVRAYRRRFFTGVLTFVLVLSVFVGGVVLRSVPLEHGLSPPPNRVWSMYNSTSCWDMSDLKFYSDALCTQEITDYECIDPDGGNVSSADCQSMLTAFESASCPGATGTAYGVAVKFSAETDVGCVAATLGPATTADFIRFDACDAGAHRYSVDWLRSNLKNSEWQENPHCTLLKPMALPEWPRGVAGTGGETMTVQLISDLDAECARFDMTVDDATEAKIQVLERGYTLETEIAFEPRLACFCETTRQNSDADWPWRDTAVRDVAPGEAPSKEHTICAEWLDTYRKKIWRTQLAGISVIFANQVLKFIFRILDKINVYKSRTESSLGSMKNLCFTQVLVTGFMVFICSLDTPIDRLHIRETGEYFDDFSPAWYLSVASGYYAVIAGNAAAVLGVQLLLKFIVGPLIRWVRQRNAYLTVMANEANEFFEWNVAGRFAESLTIIFCTMLFSGIMPGMYIIGSLYCFVAYWIDKWRLLRDCVRPPNYDHRMVKLGIQVCRLAVVMHMVIAAWAFGVQDVFPSDWGPSWAREFVEGLTGVSASEYDEIMLVYESHDHDKYQMARLNDLARMGCLPMVACFAPIFVFYFKYLFMLVFKPCVKSISTCVQMARRRAMKKISGNGPPIVSGSSSMNVWSKAVSAFAIKRSEETRETFFEIMQKEASASDANRMIAEVRKAGGGECHQIWKVPTKGETARTSEISRGSGESGSLEHKDVYTKHGHLMSYDLKWHPKYARAYEALSAAGEDEGTGIRSTSRSNPRLLSGSGDASGSSGLGDASRVADGAASGPPVSTI